MKHSETFRACASAYAVLCGPFVALALLWVVAAIKTGKFHVAPIGICLAGAIAWAVWLVRFELVVGEVEFAYRSLLLRRRTMPYSAVASIEVTARGPVTGIALGTAVKLTDGSRMPINLKVFPRRAGALLLERVGK
jgi:hypothetical protein